MAYADMYIKLTVYKSGSGDKLATTDKINIDDNIYKNIKEKIDDIIKKYTYNIDIYAYPYLYDKILDNHTLFQIFNINNRSEAINIIYYNANINNNSIKYDNNTEIKADITNGITDEKFTDNRNAIFKYIDSIERNRLLIDDTLYQEYITEFNKLKNSYDENYLKLQKYIDDNRITSDAYMNDEYKELYIKFNNIPKEIQDLNTKYNKRQEYRQYHIRFCRTTGTKWNKTPRDPHISDNMIIILSYDNDQFIVTNYPTIATILNNFKDEKFEYILSNNDKYLRYMTIFKTENNKYKITGNSIHDNTEFTSTVTDLPPKRSIYDVYKSTEYIFKKYPIEIKIGNNYIIGINKLYNDIDIIEKYIKKIILINNGDIEYNIVYNNIKYTCTLSEFLEILYKKRRMGYLKLAGVIALALVIVAVILFFSIKK